MRVFPIAIAGPQPPHYQGFTGHFATEPSTQTRVGEHTFDQRVMLGGMNSAEAEQRHLGIGPETAAARSGGEHYDLGLTIDALMSQERLIDGIVLPDDAEAEWAPQSTFN